MPLIKSFVIKSLRFIFIYTRVMKSVLCFCDWGEAHLQVWIFSGVLGLNSLLNLAGKYLIIRLNTNELQTMGELKHLNLCMF